MRLAVVLARRGDQAPGQLLGALDVHLGDHVAVVVAGDGVHGVGQVRERGDQPGPQRLADGADLAVAAQHPLLAPQLDRHVGEVGVDRAQVGHAVDVVRAVAVEELGDDPGRRLGGAGLFVSAVMAGLPAQAIAISSKRLTASRRYSCAWHQYAVTSVIRPPVDGEPPGLVDVQVLFLVDGAGVVGRLRPLHLEQRGDHVAGGDQGADADHQVGESRDQVGEHLAQRVRGRCRAGRADGR